MANATGYNRKLGPKWGQGIVTPKMPKHGKPVEKPTLALPIRKERPRAEALNILKAAREDFNNEKTS